MLEAFSDKAAAPGAVIDCKFVDHVEHWLNFLLAQLEALTGFVPPHAARLAAARRCLASPTNPTAAVSGQRLRWPQ